MRYFIATVSIILIPLAACADRRLQDCSDCPQLRLVAGGSFEMGYDKSEANPETDATPVHTVSIGYDFAVSVNEITKQQFAFFVASSGHQPKNECNIYESNSWFVKEGLNWTDPGFEQTQSEPVVCVSWHDAQAYVHWLSKQTGKNYRLLSEAEWEYIATNRGADGQLDDISYDTANLGAVECCGPRRFGKDSWDRTAPVGSFPPDALGLNDVRGNVWEWVSDCYHDGYTNAPTDGTAHDDDCSATDSRVVRGGSYGDDIFYLRAGYRLRAPSDNGYFTLGFRIARDAE